MTTITQFEDMLVWQKAHTLTIEVYRHFRTNKDHAFRDQIQRASVSIMNNISEGFERQSNKEFRQFLYIAKGSAGEVRSMLSLAINLGFLNQKQEIELRSECIEISRMLSGLIKKL
jgi:four helix bundle protein